jgi:hypothetical protein
MGGYCPRFLEHLQRHPSRLWLLGACRCQGTGRDSRDRQPHQPGAKEEALLAPEEKEDPPVLVTEHSHQWKRLWAFISSQSNSKQAKRKDGRTRKALDRAIVVPFEMEDFKTSGELGFEPQVYTLKEVTALGVTVIPWDGR